MRRGHSLAGHQRIRHQSEAPFSESALVYNRTADGFTDPCQLRDEVTGQVVRKLCYTRLVLREFDHEPSDHLGPPAPTRSATGRLLPRAAARPSFPATEHRVDRGAELEPDILCSVGIDDERFARWSDLQCDPTISCRLDGGPMARSGLTTRVLAERIGSSAANISNWERGDRLVNEERLVQLLDALEANDEEKERLLGLPRQAHGPGDSSNTSRSHAGSPTSLHCSSPGFARPATTRVRHWPTCGTSTLAWHSG